MPNKNAEIHCKRVLQSKEIMRVDANLDDVENHLLTIARFYFQSFALPQSHAWIGGLDWAETKFGELNGPVIGARVLCALMAVRHARRSVYCFNSPTCADCAAIVTEHERRFMSALKAVRAGRAGQAQTELMMLCEGNDTAPSLEALTRLSCVLPQLVGLNGDVANA